MHLGAITDIGQARGVSPLSRALNAGLALQSTGGGVAGFLVAGGAPKGSEAASWSRRAARWPSLGSDETRGRDFEIAPEGYSKGRQPGAACKADPALLASTAGLVESGESRCLDTAEGSEARHPLTAPPSRPAAQGTAPGGFGLPAHDRDAKGARPPQG